MSSRKDPHGPRLADSKELTSINGYSLVNYCHFNFEMPSVTGNIKEAFKMAVIIATKVLTDM